MTLEKKSRTASGSEISRPLSIPLLTKEQVGELLDAQRKLHDILPALDYAQECGIECKEQVADHTSQMQQISNLLKRFGGLNQ